MTDTLLRTAIAERRQISFTLSGCRRIDQTGGESRSGKPIAWRWAVLPKISELDMLDKHFPGPRAAPSERHVKWDVLFASVSADIRD